MLSENMYENVLKQTGLTEKQAKIYLACLELGQAKVPEIAKKAEIKRTTAYGILDELVSLGLVNYSQKNKQKLYRAGNPDQAPISHSSSVCSSFLSFRKTLRQCPHNIFHTRCSGRWCLQLI